MFRVLVLWLILLPFLFSILSCSSSDDDYGGLEGVWVYEDFCGIKRISKDGSWIYEEYAEDGVLGYSETGHMSNLSWELPTDGLYISEDGRRYRLQRVSTDRSAPYSSSWCQE